MKINLGHKHKIILGCIVLFLVIDAAVLFFKLASNRYSKSVLSYEGNFAAPEKLRALNKNAASGKILKSGYAYYKFTDEEQEIFSDYYRKSGSVCVSVRIGVKNAKGGKFKAATADKKLFYFGYLTGNDFSEKGKFQPLEKRIFSGCDLRNFIVNSKGYSYFDNGFAIEKNLSAESVPCGFVVYSEYPVRIVDFLVEKARVGFDCSKEIPFFGVSSNGGSFSNNLTSFDFSGCTQVFPVENTRYSIMPKIELGFSDEKTEGAEKKSDFVKINAGGDILTVRIFPGTKENLIQTSTLVAPFSYYEITGSSARVLKLLMTTNDPALIPSSPDKVLVPMKTDLGLVLSSKTSTWRTKDYEIYEWNIFPGILFFDTLNYSVQDQFFRRLAYFSEKKGFRGKLLADSELEGKHGYNAHDYGAESLAAFFSACERQNFRITQKEADLKEILIKTGVIVPDSNSYRAGKGAVISISRESPAYLRASFTAHESWHGIFFTDSDFRNAVAAVYYTVDENTMKFMKGYWASQETLGYDQDDEFLMQNEFMAYLMQQPLRFVSKYFINVANRGSVSAYQKELCEWVKRTEAATFEDACRVLDSYAYDNWGLAAGRVAMITRN